MNRFFYILSAWPRIIFFIMACSFRFSAKFMSFIKLYSLLLYLKQKGLFCCFYFSVPKQFHMPSRRIGLFAICYCWFQFPKAGFFLIILMCIMSIFIARYILYSIMYINKLPTTNIYNMKSDIVRNI